MKTTVAKLTLTTALAVTLPPLVSGAQNIAASPGTVSRGVERVTLLPGPTLLSPARGAPQSTDAISIRPAPVPAPGNNAGPTSIMTPAPFLFSPAPRGNTPPAKSAPPSPASRPDPDSLRFDSKLEPAPVPLKLETTPAPDTAARSK